MEKEVGVRVIMTENYVLIPNDELAKRAKKYGCGLLLGGSDGLSAFNQTRPPHGQKTGNLPAGRGYLIKHGQAELIQAAAYWEAGQDPARSLQNTMAKELMTE